MKFNVSESIASSDVLVVGIYSDDLALTGYPKDVSKLVLPLIKPLVDSEAIEGKFQSLVPILNAGIKGFSAVIVVGLGDKAKITSAKWRTVIGDAARAVTQYKFKSMTVVLPVGLDNSVAGQATSEGIGMGLYKFDQYKTEKKLGSLESVSVLASNEKSVASVNTGVLAGTSIAWSVNLARDLANMPPNDLFPKAFADRTRALFGSDENVTVKIIDDSDAKKLGMNDFLGVGQGSIFESYMVVIDYKPNAKQAPICLVGKGVTFDTGGISIKPSKGMGEMKADMSGGANVIAAMKAIVDLKVKRNVTAIIPMVENMPSGTAQRPGDIVKAMNGKTIEITNTDAEGRLILCDALAYAVEKVKPSEMISMATLTGACIVALGTFISGILGNNQDMVNRMIETGNETGERLWQLPLFDEYIDYLKSDVADINHCNEGREAGTVTAAKFLEQFVGDVPWVHLDIAGVMDYRKTSGYKVKGMSGEGTRNLIEYVIRSK